jgi:hypothetical protein
MANPDTPIKVLGVLPYAPVPAARIPVVEFMSHSITRELELSVT